MSEKKPPEPSDAALKARLAQLELENRVRMQRQGPTFGDVGKATPRRGFGSAQGIAHLRSTEFERRGPTPPPSPAPIPEPGKARFGGTYLQTPMPGIIAPNAEPGKELIAPVPAAPSHAAGKEAAPPLVSPFAGTPSTPVAPGPSMGPSAPAVKPLPGPGEVQRPAPATVGPLTSPVVPPSVGKVVGGGALGKAPLPAIYHAGMKSAQDAKAASAPPPPPSPSPKLPAEAPIVIPEGVEVTKDAAKEQAKAARAKRFKNPTLGPKPTDG